MLKHLFRFIFGPNLEIPPAASDHKDGDTDWAERVQNQRLKGVISKSKLEVIRQTDLRAKARYDSMDVHIMRLCELKLKIRAKKAAKRAAGMVVFEPESAT